MIGELPIPVIPGLWPPPGQPGYVPPGTPGPGLAPAAEATDATLLIGATQAYGKMSPKAQIANYDAVTTTGEGKGAFTQARAMAAGVGALVGVALGFVLFKRKKK